MSEGVTDMEQKLIDYLTEFDSATRFGKCAGRTARLSLLHENKVSSHALQIHAWGHISGKLKGIYEHHDELELNQILDFGDLSLAEANDLAEVINETDFFERYGNFLSKFKHNLTKKSVSELYSEISETLYELLNDIEGLNIPDLWYKLNSFYQWEEEQGQLRKIFSSIREPEDNDVEEDNESIDEDSNDGLDELDSSGFEKAIQVLQETLVPGLEKLAALTNAEFTGDPKVIKKFIPHFDENFLKHGHYNLTRAVESEGSNLITIFGNPGFGKTIQLRQFAHKFTEKQLDKIEDIDSVILPIFVKAKVLAKNIDKIATVPYSIDMGGNEPFNGKSVSSTDELIQVLVDSAVESEPKISKITLSEVLTEWDLSKVLVLIDAYDECQSEQDRIQILNVIADDLFESGMTVVATCRNSHQPELIGTFSHLEAGEVIQLDVSFTKHELREVMPRKLANAWGIGGEDLAYQVEQKFKEYEEVLTHPLFVGLFCLLLDDGRLEQMDDITDTIHLNLPEGAMGLRHIKFLTQVIDIGLDINIKERNTENVSEDKSHKLRTAFCHMAAANHIYNVTQMDLIFEFIEKGMKIKLDKGDKKILTENLGIIYATDGHTLDWSHPTIPEVATGILFNQDSTYSKLFKSQDGHGMMSDFWSECLIMTMASYEVEINQPIDFYKSIHSILERFDYHSTLRTLLMLEHIQTTIFSNLDFDDNTGELIPTFCENLDPILMDLGEKYIDAANTGNAFPLPLTAFELNKHIISADSRYQTEYIRAPIIHYRNASPISIIDTEAVERLFERENKAWAMRKVISTVNIYQEHYSEKEIKNFIKHVADLIKTNNYGRFELANGSWFKIIEDMINEKKFEVLLESLVDKIWDQVKFEIVVNKNSPSADFWVQRRGSENTVGKPLRRYGKVGSSNFGISVPNGTEKEDVFSFFTKKFREGYWKSNSKTYHDGRLKVISLLDIKDILKSYEIKLHNKVRISLDIESMMFVEEEFPNIHARIKPLGQEIRGTKSTGWSSYKLAFIVNRGIAKGLIWGLKNIYSKSGTKAQLGWMESHFMFRQFFGDVIGSNEWDAEEIQQASFIEFVLDVLVGCDQEWILPEILTDFDFTNTNRPNPWDLDR